MRGTSLQRPSRRGPSRLPRAKTRQQITGLTSVNTSIQKVTSSGFDSTVAGLKIGCSVNIGTSTTGSLSLVQAELFNLA